MASFEMHTCSGRQQLDGITTLPTVAACLISMLIQSQTSAFIAKKNDRNNQKQSKICLQFVPQHDSSCLEGTEYDPGHRDVCLRQKKHFAEMQRKSVTKM